jgi:hypothetical protein
MTRMTDFQVPRQKSGMRAPIVSYEMKKILNERKRDRLWRKSEPEIALKSIARLSARQA